MTTAKGPKPTSQSQQSQPKRDDYAEPEQEKRRIVPLAFLLFLTGCAAYLKSFLPVNAEEQKPQPSNKGTDDAGQTELKMDGEVSTSTEEAVADGEATTAADPVTKASDNVVPIRMALPQEAGAFPVSGSPPVEQAPLISLPAATGPIGDPVRADYRSPRSVSGDEGGGKFDGGGGGGGGEEDKQRKSRAPDTPPDPFHNRAPRTSGPVHLQDLAGNQVLMISMLTLLGGATDPDGNPLSIANISSTSGTLTETEQGGWMFVVDEGMVGDVTLTYTITDGAASVVQTARFSVLDAPSIIGTAADDSLLGTQEADTIDGGAGSDTIYARQGNDTVTAGSGDDYITAGAGNDIVYAGAGNDAVFAGPGKDVIYGGSGNDRLFGEDGDDTIMGEDGDDFISGGAGNDILSDGAGRDTVQGGAGTDHVVAAADAADDSYDGGAGHDTLDYSATTLGVTADLGNGTAHGAEIGHDRIAGFEGVVGGSGHDRISAGSTPVAMSGGAGNDALDGGTGNDTISDGSGGDTVSGGGGDDHVVAAADAANDSYDGGAGHDELDYSTATLSITVDVGGGTADGLDIGHDLIASFEEIIAGSGDDHLIAGSTSVSMTGGDGDDTFEFQRTEGDQQALTVRKITDFTVGDRIVAATYEISYLNEDGIDETISDMFDDIYLSTDGGNRPVSFRFEEVDSNQLTFVDVHDRPDTDEFFTIELVGHHHLQFNFAGG